VNIVYTKDNCGYCEKAKTLLNQKNIPYNITKIGQDITREEFLDMYPDVKTVPFIILDGEKVYGFDKLEVKLNG